MNPRQDIALEIIPKKEELSTHRIELFNLDGETVRIVNRSRNRSVSILRNLPAGLYFLRIGGDEPRIRRILIP